MSKQHNKINSSIVLVLLLTALPIIALQPIVSATPDDTTFSIMQISDTQFLAKNFPSLFNDTIDWIVNNAATYNLKMVVHTGDIVDNIDATTVSLTQWGDANKAMQKLLDAGIPYCWDAGNHDQMPWNSPTGTWSGSSYSALSATSMHSKSYWVSDFNDGKNTAVQFTCNGYKFLIINLEYSATTATIDWMKNLINNNPDCSVIVAAHSYLNKSGGYGFLGGSIDDRTWCANLKTTLDGYPNVFLTLSGHDPSGSAYNKTVGTRQEIFFDRQVIVTNSTQTNGGPYGQTGAAAVRIYTFDLSTKTVSTKTYCLDTHLWLTTAANQFSFTVNLQRPILFPVPEYSIVAFSAITASLAAYALYCNALKLKNRLRP
jgi:hypothetical protein